MLLDGAAIDAGEIRGRNYGASTASAVLKYKTKRKIINTSYQTKADNIVGKMTIAALDKEMYRFERSLREFNSCAGKRSDVAIT